MPSLQRRTVFEIALFILLVGAGVAVRLLLRDLPNFAPVAGLALFAGYYFRSRLVALAVPVCVMLISDAFIGHYAWWQMAIVYSMLALPVTMRGVLRKYFRFAEGTTSEFARSLAGLVGSSLAMSVLFFIVTNAICIGWYEPTLAGFARCYWQALPFFRFTLAGDLVFALLTFGGYATAVSLAAVMGKPNALPANERLSANAA